MAIPYVPNIPQPTDPVSVSQGQLLTNTNGVQTFLELNHGGFASANAGLHQFVQFPSGVPTIATTVGQVGLYSNTGAHSAHPELFFQAFNQLANTGYPITETGLDTNGVYRWFILPCGLLVKFGNNTTSGAGTLVVNLAGDPHFSTVYFTMVCAGNALNTFGGAPFDYTAVQTAQALPLNFTVTTTRAGATTGAVPFSFIAVGTFATPL